jgi:hypothetical protein
MATKLVKHELTRNPFDERPTHIDRFVKGIHHFQERFARILCATHSIESVTQMLLNRDIETIKFPSGYLSETLN